MLNFMPIVYIKQYMYGTYLCMVPLSLKELIFKISTKGYVNATVYLDLNKHCVVCFGQTFMRCSIMRNYARVFSVCKLDFLLKA